MLSIKAPRFLFRFDDCTISRPSMNADQLGVTYSTVYDGKGTFGLPSGKDFDYVMSIDSTQVVDTTLSLEPGVDVRQNDKVSGPRGDFLVQAVAQHRLHVRAYLRRVG